MRHLALAALLAVTGPALADSQLRLDRRLSDDDFYRAVACGAPPGGACQTDIVRWPPKWTKDLPVRVAGMGVDFIATHGRGATKALDAAIAQINGTGAALSLRRAGTDEAAPIEVWFTDIDEGAPIVLRGLALPPGDRMEGARVYLWWNNDGIIDRAVIVLSHDLAPDELGSVMLEELTQAMGLLTDVEGPAYADSSIFSESSNAVSRLAGQDRMVLRRHYPR